jgi:hypothetical protein
MPCLRCGDMSRQESPPFLEHIHLIPDPENQKQAIMVIRGNWPTPNWEHVRTEITTEGDTMEVEYLGKSRGGLAMQVLKPFEDRIELVFPHIAEWTVVVRGRGQKLESKIVIT